MSLTRSFMARFLLVFLFDLMKMKNFICVLFEKVKVSNFFLKE